MTYTRTHGQLFGTGDPDKKAKGGSAMPLYTPWRPTLRASRNWLVERCWAEGITRRSNRRLHPLPGSPYRTWTVPSPRVTMNISVCLWYVLRAQVGHASALGLARLLQGMFWQAEFQLPTYIDDPLAALIAARAWGPRASAL